VADGGDFVATGSYVLHPRGPLTWLDPGAFGTLGVGAGFALGAACTRPDREVWIVFGDGACGYGLAEFDSFVRHGIPVIAVVGNDAGWTQIAREQVKMLHDDVGTVLARTDYHAVAAGFGAEGIVVKTMDEVQPALERARELARQGRPVLVNSTRSRSATGGWPGAAARGPAHCARCVRWRNAAAPAAPGTAQRSRAPIAEAVVLAGQHAIGDRQQFVGRVVGKVDVVGDARAHAGVGLEEGVHAVLVAGQDHHQVVALVLHHLQQDLDGLLAVVAFVLGAVQVVGLVDEEHAAHGLLEHLLGLGRGVASGLSVA
jgi:hypothetical protein